MIDLFNFTDITANHQIFYTNGSGDAWQTWQKPKNVGWVYITCIGGGGGGGSSPNSSGNQAGGGGGASSSLTKILIPSNLLPDLLYIQVGPGGAGGTASSENSVDGSLSYVSILPSKTATDVVIASGTAAAGRGLRGTSTVGSGQGGAGGTAFTSAVGILSELGIWQSIAGRGGSDGGYTTFGQSVLGISGGIILTGGAGGGGLATGGIDYQGGSISTVGLVPSLTGGAAGGGAGRSGYATVIPNRLLYSSTKNPMIFTGGSGGGGNATISGGGGNGGNGQIGCGGGGSGAIDGGTGRVGGRGGNGLVLITTF